MPSLQSRLKHIDKNAKYLVSRYIHEQHTILFKSNTCVLFQSIPIAISSLCIVSYYLMDHFETANHNKTNISKDKKTITQHARYGFTFGASSSGSAFGSLNIPSNDKESLYYYLSWRSAKLFWKC